METPFRAQSFVKHQVVTKDDLEVTQANLQWLEDNTPRSRFFRDNGTPVDVRSIVISGRTGFGKSKKQTTVRKRVHFGSAFHPACHPNVMSGIISDAAQEIFVIFNGPGGAVLPTASGFEVVAHVKDNNTKDKWKISKPFYVSWHAYGFRRNDIHAL